MTDLNSEQLNGKYKQAYEFAMNDHLQAKQDLDAAKQEIETGGPVADCCWPPLDEAPFTDRWFALPSNWFAAVTR